MPLINLISYFILVVTIIVFLFIGAEMVHFYKFRNDQEYRNKYKIETWKNTLNNFYLVENTTEPNENLDYFKEAILCDCLNKVNICDYKTLNNDGSLGAYIELGNFSIEEFEKEKNITNNFLDTLNLISKHGSDLRIMKCLKRIRFID